MPIPLPQLDDRRYDDLVEEMRALIPRYAPEWTDHNASDPGIMLVELFTWLTEAIIYRLNRVPVSSELRFLELLDPEVYKEIISKQPSAEQQEELASAFNQATRKIHSPWRAVTIKDFEDITKKHNAFLFSIALNCDYASELDEGDVSRSLRMQFQRYDKTLSAKPTVEQKQPGNRWKVVDGVVVNDLVEKVVDGQKNYFILKEDQKLNVYHEWVKQPVARVKCLPETDLTLCNGEFACVGNVSLIVVENSSVEDPVGLLKKLKQEVNERRLINTRLHVVGPRYVPIFVEAEVVLTARAKPETVRGSIIERLVRGFDPGKSGPRPGQVGSVSGQSGFEPWQFGRPVTNSEVYQWIDETPGVDYVNALRLWGRRFLFCVAVSIAKPPEDAPDEVRQLRLGQLPVKLWKALKKLDRNLPPAESFLVTEVEGIAGNEKYRIFRKNSSNAFDDKEAYEVVWNGGLPDEGGLLDVYDRFAPAVQKDGIEQIELPIDGLVLFDKDLTDKDLTVITPRILR